MLLNILVSQAVKIIDRESAGTYAAEHAVVLWKVNNNTCVRTVSKNNSLINNTRECPLQNFGKSVHTFYPSAAAKIGSPIMLCAEF